MKTNNQTLLSLTARIKSEIQILERKTVEVINEFSLIEELKASPWGARHKVMTYLRRTTAICETIGRTQVVKIPSSKLGKMLHIHSHEMKPVRDDLSEESVIDILHDDAGRISIMFTRRRGNELTA